ncbi:MAG: MoaD/ThiS family protein [Promethearchaeota archaeon]
MKHVEHNIASTIGIFNSIGYESKKEVKIMPKIELHIYPPLSYEMTSKRVGDLIIEIQVEQGDTLGDLLVRLYTENQNAWKKLIDVQNKKMRNPIRTILNGKALSPSVLAHTPLSDGDQIKFVIIYGGG